MILTKWIERVTVFEPLRCYSYEVHCEGLAPYPFERWEKGSRIAPKGTIIYTKIKKWDEIK